MNESIIDRKILFENKNITSTPIKHVSGSSEIIKYDLDEEKIEMDKNENQINTLNSFQKSKTLIFNEKLGNSNNHTDNNSGVSNIESNFSDINMKKTKIKSTQNLINISACLSSPDKDKMKLNNLIKHLISFENLKYLKNLKIEIKDIMDKHNPSKVSTDFNNKMYELLKSNLFNEIFDNLLTKFIQVFYKSINTLPDFTSKLENILLYYFKVKNNLRVQDLIDLENYNHIY
jgi:hypothetical protein